MLCRGIFTPHSDVVETKWENHVFAAVFQPESGGYSLAGAFAEVRFCSSSLFLGLFSVSSNRCSTTSLRLAHLSFLEHTTPHHTDALQPLPPRLFLQCFAADTDIISLLGSQVREGCADYPRALRAARQAFPFLEPLTR